MDRILCCVHTQLNSSDLLFISGKAHFQNFKNRLFNEEKCSYTALAGLSPSSSGALVMTVILYLVFGFFTGRLQLKHFLVDRMMMYLSRTIGTERKK